MWYFYGVHSPGAPIKAAHFGGFFFYFAVLDSDLLTKFLAHKVRPNDDGEYAAPKTEAQIADREKPADSPQTSKRILMCNDYVMHAFTLAQQKARK